MYTASTEVNTVDGPRTMNILCDGTSVFPYIVLAENIEGIEEEDEDEIVLYLNSVNIMYGNCVVALITFGEDYKMSVSLRGIVTTTFQNELSLKNYKEDVSFMSAVGNIYDFIDNVNNSHGNETLSELMHMLSLL